MKKSIALWAAAMLAAATSVPAFAQAKADMELDQASQIMQQLTGPQSTAGIPDAVLKDAKCVAVIPKMIKGGFVVGAQHGDGVVTSPRQRRLEPARSLPAFRRQFWRADRRGGAGYVMMVMDHNGMQALQSGHFKLGAGVGTSSRSGGPRGFGLGGMEGLHPQLLQRQGRVYRRDHRWRGAEPGPRQDQGPLRK